MNSKAAPVRIPDGDYSSMPFSTSFPQRRVACFCLQEGFYAKMGGLSETKSLTCKIEKCRETLIFLELRILI